MNPITLFRWNFMCHRMQGKSIFRAALLALIDARRPADF